jgi:hypothetical protein
MSHTDNVVTDAELDAYIGSTGWTTSLGEGFRQEIALLA